MPSREPAAWPAGPALSYGLIGGAAVVAVGSGLLGSDAWVVRVVIGVAVVAAMVGGVVRNRPAPVAAWVLMTGAVGLWVAGDTLWDWLTARGIDTPANTHWADLVYLGGYVLIGLGQSLLGRGRGRKHLADGMVDGGVLAVAAVIVVWVTLIAPQQYPGTSSLDRAILAGYPLCDGLLLAGIAWLAFTPARRGASLVLLGLGMSTILTADLLWNIAARSGVDWDVWINPMYPIVDAALAAAAIHPSVRHLTEPDPRRTENVHIGVILVFLGAAMFAGPLAVMAADDEFGASDVMLTACSLVVVVLVIIRFIGLVRDNERAQERFRLLAENVPVGIYEVSGDLEISFANAAADRLFGRSVEAQRASDLLAFVDPDDREQMVDAADTVLDGQPEVAFRLLDADGSVRWVQWRGTPVADHGRGRPVALASTLDITSLKEAQAALERQATHDPLTQLPNRRLLSDLVTGAFARRGRHPGTVALMFCDLDGFKTVNDVHGHDAGDAILVEIGRRLCTTARVTDAVTRMGGDEFVVVCEEAGSHDDLATLAAKLIGSVNQPLAFEDNVLSVGVSIGIAIAGVGDDVGSLLRRADDAMYRAKAEGRNRFTFAETELPEVAGLHRVGEVDR